MKLIPLALVGLGGAVGSIARFLVGTAVQVRVGDRWPLGTFVVNVSGCFLIGFFLTLTTERYVAHEHWRYLIPIGFIGGYTTFSSYQMETLRLVQIGGWLRALSYVVASTVAGFAAVALAAAVARRL